MIYTPLATLQVKLHSEEVKRSDCSIWKGYW